MNIGRADVTYLRLGRRWVYLVVTLDLWSRRIVSWKRSDRLTAALLECLTRSATSPPTRAC